MATIFVDTPNTLMQDALRARLGEENFKLTAELAPYVDVALIDLQGATSPYPAPPACPTLAIVSGNGENSENEIVQLLHLGYKGYLRPEESRDKIVPAIRALLREEVWGERRLISRALEKSDTHQLTRREQQVHHLVVSGLSNREIGEKLDISEKTVKGYVTNLLSKLEAKKRTELICRAQLLSRGS